MLKNISNKTRALSLEEPCLVNFRSFSDKPVALVPEIMKFIEAKAIAIIVEMDIICLQHPSHTRSRLFKIRIIPKWESKTKSVELVQDSPLDNLEKNSDKA